jgi:hypothetical protein
LSLNQSLFPLRNLNLQCSLNVHSFYSHFQCLHPNLSISIGDKQKTLWTSKGGDRKREDAITKSNGVLQGLIGKWSRALRGLWLYCSSLFVAVCIIYKVHVYIQASAEMFRKFISKSNSVLEYLLYLYCVTDGSGCNMDFYGNRKSYRVISRDLRNHRSCTTMWKWNIKVTHCQKKINTTHHHISYEICNYQQES